MKLIKKLTILMTFVYCFSIASQTTTYFNWNDIKCRICHNSPESKQSCCGTYK